MDSACGTPKADPSTGIKRCAEECVIIQMAIEITIKKNKMMWDVCVTGYRSICKHSYNLRYNEYGVEDTKEIDGRTTSSNGTTKCLRRTRHWTMDQLVASR